MQYQVTWGAESEVVAADSEVAAWSAFCGKHDEALRHPKQFEREIVEVDAEPEEVENIAVSPVADEAAKVAIDEISRMRSGEKLQEIIDTDQRATVVYAAKKRLEQL